jgi:nitroimidazol reductase NimA-like FMN-containing flavoprotein (pyridoxamine 5'-phosphate oxidase superfamily)
MEPQELDTSECRRLLESGVFGRVALSTPNGPHIVPVNYAAADDRILFRTTPYSVLGTYGRNAELAFEVDHVDYEYASGWSVVARGRGDVLVDPREVQELTGGWMPRPWADGTRNLFFALTWREISGRRLGPSLGDAHDLPVSRQAIRR